jgi:hypothetical protein
MNIALGDLRAAYRRISGRIYRILEDGYDFSAEDRLIDVLDRDALIVDAAFFVLIFGQIENRINELAGRKLTTERQRLALRDTKFGRRMGMTLPGPDNKAVRDEIESWYGLRSEAAYCERLTTYNIANVFDRADQLESLLQ